MYNGPLPPPPQHKPCLSFDDDGRYIGDTAELVAVFSKENAPPSQTPDQANAGTFNGVASALPLPGRPQKESDTSDRQLSITSTAPPGTAVGVAKQPFVQTVHRPFTQVSFIKTMLREMSFRAKHRTCLDLNATKIINAIMLCAKLVLCGVEEGTIFRTIFDEPVRCELLNQPQNLASVKNALDVILWTMLHGVNVPRSFVA